MDGNCSVMESFIMANNSNGIPVSTHTTCTGNWQATFSTAMASAMGQAGVNIVTLGTQTGLQELTRRDCGPDNCRPQQVFNLQGGTSLASSQAVNDNANYLQQGTQISLGGACGTGNCPTTQPNPHPAGTAQSVGKAPGGN
jgi:hypothetical protein